MGREFELKYAATEESRLAILAFYGDFDTVTMETTYYDTPDRRLSASRITLRRRMENGRSVCTLKTPGTGLGRGEWEMECSDIHTAAPELARLSGRQETDFLDLEAVCGAAFTRQVRTLALSACTVEIAVDRGFLLGGGRKEPLCEVEVELKDGSEEGCVAFAAGLAAQFGLTPEGKSKFKRALDLAARGQAVT